MVLIKELMKPQKSKFSLWTPESSFVFQVGHSGKVIGIDHIKELVDDSITNVKKDDPMLLSSGRVRLVGE